MESSIQDSDTRQPENHLSEVALVGFGYFVIAMTVLHLTQPDLNPLTQALSYYVHGPQGWLLASALLALGFGSFLLAIRIRSSVHSRAAQIGWWFLILWSICAILGGIFPTDPPGNWDAPMSIAGTIHGIAAIFAILALPISAVLLQKELMLRIRGTLAFQLLRILTFAVVVGFILFMFSLVPVLISPGPPVLLGLTERILFVTYVAWLGTVTYDLRYVSEQILN